MDPKYKKGALILAGAAVVAFVVVPKILPKKTGVETTCALTTAAVTTIVIGVTHGKDAEEIVGPALSGVFVPLACKPLVQSLISDPQKPVSFNLQRGPAGTISQTVTGTNLLSPPPTNPPPNSGLRDIQCLGYPSSFQYQLCVDGLIGPLTTP